MTMLLFANLSRRPLQSDSEDTQNNDMPVSAASTITYNGKTYQKNENIVNLLFFGIDTDEARRAIKPGL